MSSIQGLGTAARLDVRFSITVRQDARTRAAIDAIDHDAGTPIPYQLNIARPPALTSPRPAHGLGGVNGHARTVR